MITSELTIEGEFIVKELPEGVRQPLKKIKLKMQGMPWAPVEIVSFKSLNKSKEDKMKIERVSPDTTELRIWFTKTDSEDLRNELEKQLGVLEQNIELSVPNLINFLKELNKKL